MDKLFDPGSWVIIESINMLIVYLRVGIIRFG